MALDKRQKILLPLIILAFAYIAWQIYDLFFADSSPDNTKSSLRPSAIVHTVQTPPITLAEKQLGPAAPTTPNPPREALPSGQEATQPSIFGPLPEQDVVESTITAEQSEYLKLVNRYNLLKLKHLLLEEEAAIAAAKQRIVKSRSEISSLGGEDWEDRLDLEGGSPKIGYELVYLDYQKGRWNALLNRGGRFFEVHQGMQMMNGDHVVSVNKEGVIINHKGQLFQITFDGSRLISGSGNNNQKPESSEPIGASMLENEMIEHANPQSEDDAHPETALQIPEDEKDGMETAPQNKPLGKQIAVPFQETGPAKKNTPAPKIPVKKSTDDKELAGVKTVGEPTVEPSVIKPAPMVANKPELAPQEKINQAVPQPQPQPQQKPVTPPVQVKASKTVEKAQKWFSGVWSNQAAKKENSNIEVLTPADVIKSESQKAAVPSKMLMQPRPASIPEPVFLNNKQVKDKKAPNSDKKKVSEAFGSFDKESGKTDLK